METIIGVILLTVIVFVVIAFSLVVISFVVAVVYGRLLVKAHLTLSLNLVNKPTDSSFTQFGNFQKACWFQLIGEFVAVYWL